MTVAATTKYAILFPFCYKKSFYALHWREIDYPLNKYILKVTGQILATPNKLFRHMLSFPFSHLTVNAKILL